jgi:hypothetical protein
MEIQIKLEMEVMRLFGYRNDKGILLWTSNELFARIRSEFYSTNDIFIENK